MAYMVIEIAETLVQRLGYADHLAVLVVDRNAENIPGTVAGMPVDFLIEARVGIGVVNDFRLTAGKHRAGNAEMDGEADFSYDIALHHPREQLIGLGIVKEQRAAVGVECFGRRIRLQ